MITETTSDILFATTIIDAQKIPDPAFVLERFPTKIQTFSR